MRYIAILKDSLREARDSWVLLGLLTFSTFVILLVFSLSFTPLSAERTMRLFFAERPFEPPPIFVALNNRKTEKVIVLQEQMLTQIRLEKVELLKGKPDSPESDYALFVSMGHRLRGRPVPGDGKEDGEKQKVAEREAAEIKDIRNYFEDAVETGYIKIGEIKSLNNDKQDGPGRYLVTVQGTPNTYRIWATDTSLFFGAVPLDFFFSDAPFGFRIYKVAKLFITYGSWIAVLLAIVVTAFFIPNMLRKGTVDFLLAKPINRVTLLFYKYLGGLTFIFITNAYAIGGIWLALGLRSGLWANGILLLIFSLTFFFAILYAISTFVGVVTRSVVMSILVTVVAYAILGLLGLANWGVELFERVEKEMQKMPQVRGNQPPEKPAWIAPTFNVIKVLYAVSPRIEDVNAINDLVVYTDFMTGGLADMKKFDTSERSWWVALPMATFWIIFFLGLATLWFYYKDY